MCPPKGDLHREMRGQLGLDAVGGTGLVLLTQCMSVCPRSSLQPHLNFSKVDALENRTADPR